MAIKQTYRAKMLKLAALALVASAAAGLIAGGILRLGPPFWLVFPAMLLIFAIGFAAVHPWWRKLDDMQRSGQLISWYWGGLIGAAVALVALVAATGSRSQYSLGGQAVFLTQTAVSGVIWVIWRFRLRGPVE
jgi:FtsH-binding integral membrane protein